MYVHPQPFEHQGGHYAVYACEEGNTPISGHQGRSTTPHVFGPCCILCLRLARGKDEAPKAVELLTKALELCEKSGDDDSKASTLCNLGAAMMQVIGHGWGGTHRQLFLLRCV